MTIASTKSPRNRNARAGASVSREGERNRHDVSPSQPSDLSERAWRISCVSIFCIGAFLRIYNLSLVPLHHDEGVNGNFLVRLVREHAYQYDPANYHGPTLYYFSALIPWLLKLVFGTSARETYGLNTVTIRLVPALFGLATIGLVMVLRRQIGTIAALAAALLLAISPGAVYLSRYFIHETLFVFFTLAAIVAGLKFYQDRNPTYLILSAASLALLFATKETAMISAAVVAIAFGSTHLYRWLYRKAAGNKKKSKRSLSGAGGDKFRQFIDELGGPTQLSIWIAVGIGVFVALNILFYSSFFTNSKGIYDALKTFDFWTKTGKESHVHPPLTYLYWLAKQEMPLLFLGAMGAGFTIWKPKNPFALFTALWAFGLIAAYSLVPYKTPWLTLNFIVPLAILSGYAIQSIYELDMRQLRLPVFVMAAAVVVGVYQTVDLNFFNYDNDSDRYVYVYAHTRRQTIDLVNEINKIAQQSPEGNQIGITIVSPDYWPLPWYLRNFSRVGYYGRMTPSSEAVIIASETQQAEVESTFGARYRQVPSGNADGSFPLRPGVSLLLYARRDGSP